MFHSTSQMSASADATASQPLDTPHSDVQTSEQHRSQNASTDSVYSDIQQQATAEPREHRRPHRPGIVWAAGSRLEARDFLNKWYVRICIETYQRDDCFDSISAI